MLQSGHFQIERFNAFLKIYFKSTHLLDEGLGVGSKGYAILLVSPDILSVTFTLLVI